MNSLLKIPRVWQVLIACILTTGIAVSGDVLPAPPDLVVPSLGTPPAAPTIPPPPVLPTIPDPPAPPVSVPPAAVPPAPSVTPTTTATSLPPAAPTTPTVPTAVLAPITTNTPISAASNGNPLARAQVGDFVRYQVVTEKPSMRRDLPPLQLQQDTTVVLTAKDGNNIGQILYIIQDTNDPFTAATGGYRYPQQVDITKPLHPGEFIKLLDVYQYPVQYQATRVVNQEQGEVTINNQSVSCMIVTMQTPIAPPNGVVSSKMWLTDNLPFGAPAQIEAELQLANGNVRAKAVFVQTGSNHPAGTSR